MRPTIAEAVCRTRPTRERGGGIVRVGVASTISDRTRVMPN
jgi:hypothetical protein